MLNWAVSHNIPKQSNLNVYKQHTRLYIQPIHQIHTECSSSSTVWCSDTDPGYFLRFLSVLQPAERHSTTCVTGTCFHCLPSAQRLKAAYWSEIIKLDDIIHWSFSLTVCGQTLYKTGTINIYMLADKKNRQCWTESKCWRAPRDRAWNQPCNSQSCWM